MSIATASDRRNTAGETAAGERGGAGRADPGARAAPDRAYDGERDPAPVPLELQPVGHLQRGVPAEIHLRRA